MNSKNVDGSKKDVNLKKQKEERGREMKKQNTNTSIKPTNEQRKETTK